MKYCPHCGEAIADEEVGKPTLQNNRFETEVMKTVIKIFMVIACAAASLLIGTGGLLISYLTQLDVSSLTGIFYLIYGIFGLCLCVYMTKQVYTKFRLNQSISTAKKIVILIFCSVISGVLLLCLPEEESD